MNEQAHKKLTKARIKMIIGNPFWGTLALRLQLKEDSTMPTAWVNGKTVGYNPDFVNQLTDAEAITLLGHEVGHCIFNHVARRGARDPRRWNHAGDYAINLLLKETGFTEVSEEHGGWLYDPKYKGMTADQIYNLLADEEQKGGGKGKGSGEALCDIRCEEVARDPSVIDEWKIATIQAANAARLAGKLPAGMERFVHDLINPKADWRTTLRRFVTEKSKDDYSWARPKKMMIAHGMYMPALYSESMGEVIIAVDTSGSITQKMLDVFQSEIQAIREAVKPRITRIIYCDAAVNHVDEFSASDMLELKMHGGGGTDFRPPFNRVLNEGWNPACFLYLTDGYGPFPDAPPDYPVLWCMTTAVEPPWGERIEIEVD